MAGALNIDPATVRNLTIANKQLYDKMSDLIEVLGGNVAKKPTPTEAKKQAADNYKKAATDRFKQIRKLWETRWSKPFVTMWKGFLNTKLFATFREGWSRITGVISKHVGDVLGELGEVVELGKSLFKFAWNTMKDIATLGFKGIALPFKWMFGMSRRQLKEEKNQTSWLKRIFGQLSGNEKSSKAIASAIKKGSKKGPGKKTDDSDGGFLSFLPMLAGLIPTASSLIGPIVAGVAGAILAKLIGPEGKAGNEARELRESGLTDSIVRGTSAIHGLKTGRSPGLKEASKLGKFVKGFGSKIPLLGGLIEAGATTLETGSFKRGALKGGGTALGAMIGGGLGTLIPIPVVGSMLGSMGGAWLGGKLGETIDDWTSPKEGDIEDFLSKVATKESGNRNVKSSTSSASGFYQIINDTWKRFGGSTPTAMDASPTEQKEIASKIVDEGARRLQSAGLPVSYRNLYYFWHFGKIPSKDVSMDRLVTEQISREAIAANPQLRGMTLGGFQAKSQEYGLGEQVIKSRGDAFANLNPDFKSRLNNAFNEFRAVTGRDPMVTSGFRSYAKQAQLFNKLPRGMAARPGTSLHETGNAIDISSSDMGVLAPILQKHGLYRPMPGKEPWHVESMGDAKSQISLSSLFDATAMPIIKNFSKTIPTLIPTEMKSLKDMAARPGTSLHESGNAIDISSSDMGVLAPILQKYGLYRPMPGKEPWHVESMGDTRMSLSSLLGATALPIIKTFGETIPTLIPAEMKSLKGIGQGLQEFEKAQNELTQIEGQLSQSSSTVQAPVQSAPSPSSIGSNMNNISMGNSGASDRKEIPANLWETMPSVFLSVMMA